MKKLLFLLMSSIGILFQTSYSQTLQASLGPGSTVSSIIIYVKPDATQTPASISTLQFNVAIDASVTPKPTLSLVTNPTFGATWIVDPGYLEGGYYNYNIYTSASPLSPNLTINTEVAVMELTFSAPFVTTSSNVYLVTLPDGGTIHAGYGVFYCTGTINSDGHSNLYYPKGSAFVDNQFSYDNPNFAVAGTGTSVATLPAGVLPIKLTDFSVTKKNNDAILSWLVSNQDANSSHFELERSFNGSDFKKIGRVDVNLNNGTYLFDDKDGVASSAYSVIYYRLRMVDKDGRSTLSSVKNIRLTNKSFAVNVYPNPAKQFSNVSIELENASAVILSLSDASGKIVQRTEFNGYKGLNQKKIELSNLASGSYLLKVNSGNEIQTVSIIKE